MGRLLLKDGVDLGTELTPAGARILDELKRVARAVPFDVAITSARDGEHSGPLDPHKTGEAFDIRTNNLKPAYKLQLLKALQDALYRDPRRFYAFLENPGTATEHIHCQRRKGTAYTLLDYLIDA